MHRQHPPRAMATNFHGRSRTRNRPDQTGISDPAAGGPIPHPDPLATPPAACLAPETSLYRAAPGHPEAGPARSLRLSVRTSDFQSEKTGSTPVGSANVFNELEYRRSDKADRLQ